uniref:Uncharacterized protein n=1 Tax=Neovison vison TaxID=452646 RepID=A0A8C7ENU1_NEOVI
KNQDIHQQFFLNSYCKLCLPKLVSEDRRVSKYPSIKQAEKIDFYYLLGSRSGGCPPERNHKENTGDIDLTLKKKCCSLCSTIFSSKMFKDSFLRGKIGANRRKALLGEKTPLSTGNSPLKAMSPPRSQDTRAPILSSPQIRKDSERICNLCSEWFDN